MRGMRLLVRPQDRSAELQSGEYTFSSAEASQRRSMSGPSGPNILPSSALRGLSTENREVARQWRNSQESRRQSKVHLRRTRLPSTSDARSNKAQNVGCSIDFFAASSTSSSYDVGSNLGSAPYGRTNSVSSSHGPYMGGISA